MKTNRQFSHWFALPTFLIAIMWSGHVRAATVASIQSGDWENTATWDCGCIPGAGDAITISGGTTVKMNATHFTGDLTVNGTLDTNDQFLEFEGATLANNGSIVSSTGSFGEIDFVGIGDAASTTQTIAGTGSYAAGTSFPVEIHLSNSTTVTPASGTVIGGVRSLFIASGSTLSLPHTFVFESGAINSNGTVSGTGPLQTQLLVALTLDGATTAPLEVVSGTTTAEGFFGAVTIDNGATLLQSSTVTPGGDFTVASGATLDTNDRFLEFEGTNFANHGSIISSIGNFGEIDFVGIGDAASTTQTIAGTGSYAAGVSFPVEIHISNSTTVTPASGTVISGVRNLFINSGSTLSLPHTFVFESGAINSNGTVAGTGPLQTELLVALNLDGTTTAPLEVVSGTTTANGNFGPVTIDNGATLFQSGTVTPGGDFTVASGGILDTDDQFLEFEGTTFANHGSIISSIGNFGEIDFVGIGDAASTTQTIAGTGSYAAGTSFPVEIHISNSTTVTPASGTVISGVRSLFIAVGSTLSLPNTFVFENGAINSNGTVAGAGPLQTQLLVALSLDGTTTAPLEVVSGTTSANGFFGAVTIDNGATLFQSGTLTPGGDFTVASGGTLDMNNGFLIFQGATFTNNGALISSVGNGEFRFNGLSGAGSSSQNLAGTGTYNTNGPVDIRLVNSVTVTAVSSTVLNGVRFLTIDTGSTANNDGAIAPGFPPGQLNFTGDLELGSTSNLSFEIGGTAPITQYDVLDKNDGGTLTLNGNLTVRLINGFTPANTDTFTVVITQTILAGAFTNVPSGTRLNTADGGGSFQVDYNVVNNALLSRNVTLSNFLPSVIITGNKVDGNGTIAVPGGQASFSFHVKELKKNKFRSYLDYNDPFNGLTFGSLKITTLNISGNHATFVGAKKFQGKRVTFTVNIIDNGNPGTNDFFSITTNNNTYSAGGNLTSGNILLHF